MLRAVPDVAVDRVVVLLGTSLFGDLSPAELEPLARAATIRRAVRGEHIFEVGEAADAIYIVVSGQLKDATYSDDGAEITHSLWEPGQFFGEVGFFARSRRRVMSMQALEPSTLVVLGREALTAFLARHPAVALKLLEDIATTSQWQTGMYLTLARRPLADRVVLRLLDLAEASGTADADVALTPRLSQSTLAAMVGASRENVNRALGVLAAEGSVLAVEGRYRIADPDRARRRIVAGWSAVSAGPNDR
jgi:CRP/FNR family cyclic AMP-dependent transcriptional regulator